jgi:3-methyladenine DNA glycosylase AlkD
MHKALGWMLREVGKRGELVLQKFIGQYAPQLPRVTLRYSIERMSESERKRWLALKGPCLGSQC